MESIIKKKVERLILFNDIEQKSQEWLEQRHNMLTASEIAPIFDVHPYMSKKQLLINKCNPPQSINNEYTIWGEFFEPIARDIYKQLFLVDHIYETGCVPHSKYDFLGASPDGILPSGKLVEIKCPKTRAIDENHIPHMYWLQCQLQMEVCNLNECDFFQCKFYQYQSKQEYLNDLTTKHKGFVRSNNLYWKLEKFTISTIKRDTRWFIKNVDTMKNFWNMVLHYRNVGIDAIDNDDDVKTKQITDWSEWVFASQLKNYILNDTCLDYIQMLHRNNKRSDNFLETTKTKKIITLDNYLNDHIDYGNSFMELICNQGRLFERHVVQLLTNSYKVTMITTEDTQARSIVKLRETINAMKKGDPIIYHGVLHNPTTKTYGVPDLLVRSDIVNKIITTPVLSKSQEKQKCKFHKKFHYVVVDIKYSTLKLCSNGINLLNSGMTKVTKAQLYIYNQALGYIQDYVPPHAYVLGKKWKYTCCGESFTNNSCFDRLGVIDYDNYDSEYAFDVSDALDWCKELREKFDTFTLFPPNDPRLYPNMCNKYDHPYHSVKHKLSKEINEITSIWYCNSEHRDIAFEKGIVDWKDKKCTFKTLGISGEYRVPRIQAILQINRQEKDNVRCLNYQNICKWMSEFPTDLFVDFETVNKNDFNPKDNTIYSKDESVITIIGCGYIHNNKWIFKKFTVDQITYEEETRIIQEFYDYMTGLNKRTRSHSNPRIFHWGHIERTLLEKAINRNPMRNWRKLNWVDLCKILQDEIIVFKGALNYNLKEVANALYNNKLIKTCWKNESKTVNGLDAMVSMLKCNDVAVLNKQSLQTMDVIKDIEKYNEIDCKVMWEILKVLRVSIGSIINAGKSVKQK